MASAGSRGGVSREGQGHGSGQGQVGPGASGFLETEGCSLGNL